MRETDWETLVDRIGFARRACDVDIDLRVIDDSCMMDGAILRIASVLLAIVRGRTKGSKGNADGVEYQGRNNLRTLGRKKKRFDKLQHCVAVLGESV
jgi:hypothetical protein